MFFWNGPWLVVAVILVWVLFGRRRGRGYRPGRLEGGIDDREAAALRGELNEQREYISSLEARVAELENRQDFTERLLAAPREKDQHQVM